MSPWGGRPCAERARAERARAERAGAERAGAERARRRACGDGGAAAVEFVMMSVLLILLLFAVLQAAVFFYARNVAAASAADAARFAAAEGVDPRAGAQRAEQLLNAGLDDADARAIRCTSGLAHDRESGLIVTTVHCRGRIPLAFSPLKLPLIVDVTSSVLREGRR